MGHPKPIATTLIPLLLVLLSLLVHPCHAIMGCNWWQDYDYTWTEPGNGTISLIKTVPVSSTLQIEETCCHECIHTPNCYKFFMDYRATSVITKIKGKRKKRTLYRGQCSLYTDAAVKKLWNHSTCLPRVKHPCRHSYGYMSIS